MHPQYTYDKKWKYRLTEDLSVFCGTLRHINYEFSTEVDGFCINWVKIVNGQVNIRKGYSCDGCSCAPDFYDALIGCFLHDALRQCVTVDPNCPFTSKETDICFYNCMKESKFKFTSIYFRAVSGPLGWIFSRLTAWRTKAKYTLCDCNE